MDSLWLLRVTRDLLMATALEAGADRAWTGALRGSLIER